MVLLFTTCEDRKRSNPFDPEVDLDAWAPSDLQVFIISDSDIKLTWTQEEERISGFRIDRKAGSESFTQIAQVGKDVTEYTDTGLNYGTDYTYRVKAFSDENESGYAMSNTTTMSIPSPSNLVAIPLNDSEIQLTWSDNCSFETGSAIERSSDGSFTQIAEVDADVTEYTDAGLTLGTGYTYRVKAFVDANESNYAEVTVNFWYDCNADWGGSAYENECGCVGGNTGLEEDFCYGCTDSDADNYDPYAIIDDGSCIYTVTDIDGNVYQAVYIGDKLWMTENLKVTHYQNGEAISYITNNVGWATATSGAYCVYDNNQTNAETYGYLYNGYAVEDSRNIAPEGWHVPQDWEWQVSVNYLGGDLVAGGKLKEVGTEHWQSPNTGATNESGFTGLPGGERWPVSGDFHSITYIGGFWTSSTSISEDLLWTWYLGYNYSDAYRIDSGKWSGYSVRCVKDQFSIC